MRAVFLGSNPHSKGLCVSLVVRCREAVMYAISVRRLGSTSASVRAGVSVAIL